MSKCHRVVGFIVAALATTFVGPASAALLLYEPFNYPPGDRLGGSGTNAVGKVAPNGQTWITRSPASGGTYDPAKDTLITSGNFSYPGLAPSSGNSVRYGSSVSNNPTLYTDAIDLPGNPFTSGSVYYSAIVRFHTTNAFGSASRTSYAAFSEDPADPLTDAGFGVITASGSVNIPLPAGAWIRNSGTTQFHLGSGKQNGDGMGTSAGAPSWQAASAFPNQQGNTAGTGQDWATIENNIYFIVLKYTFVGSGPGNDDTVSMWINPIASTLGDDAGEAGAGAAGGSYYSATNATVTANVDASALGIQSFMLIGNAQSSQRGDKTIDVSLDELRIGTTWADVTPAPPLLTIGPSGTTAVLAWPTNFTDYFLISSADIALDRTTWSSVTNAVSVNGTNYNVTVDLLAPMQFYSLVRTNQP